MTTHATPFCSNLADQLGAFNAARGRSSGSAAHQAQKLVPPILGTLNALLASPSSHLDDKDEEATGLTSLRGKGLTSLAGSSLGAGGPLNPKVLRRRASAEEEILGLARKREATRSKGSGGHVEAGPSRAERAGRAKDPTRATRGLVERARRHGATNAHHRGVGEGKTGSEDEEDKSSQRNVIKAKSKTEVMRHAMFHRCALLRRLGVMWLASFCSHPSA